MSNEFDDSMKELTNANPYPKSSEIKQSFSKKDVMFKEIVMDNQNNNNSNKLIEKHWWRSPISAIPVGFATLLLMVGGVFVFNNFKPSPAYAEVISEASNNASEFDSGVVELEMDIKQAPDEQPGKLVQKYSFDGDNSETVLDLTGFANNPSPKSIDKTNEDWATIFKVITHDGYTYFDDGKGAWSKVKLTKEAKFNEGSLLDSYSYSKEQLNPKTVIDLVNKTNSLEDLGSEDDQKVYSGVIDVEDLINTKSQDLPVGLSLLTESDDDLPKSIQVKFFIKDDLLSKVEVIINGDTKIGYVDAVITTKFSNLGEDIVITPPKSAKLIEVDGLDDEYSADGFGVILDDLEKRKPGLCQEVYNDADIPEISPSEDFSEEDFKKLNEKVREIDEAYINCLSKNGENEAAEAYREIMNVE